MHVDAEGFCDADGVGEAATRGVGGVAIEHFTECADSAFVKFGPECHSFTDHMVIADVWRSGGKVPALMRAAAFKLARNGGPLFFDFTYCPPWCACIGKSVIAAIANIWRLLRACRSP